MQKQNHKGPIVKEGAWIVETEMTRTKGVIKAPKKLEDYFIHLEASEVILEMWELQEKSRILLVIGGR